MLLNRKTLTFAVVALLAVAACFTLAGHPLVPPDALAAFGMVPVFMTGELDMKALKDAIDAQGQAMADFRKHNDQLIAAKADGKSIGDMEAKLQKIQTDLAAALDLKKEIERIEAKANVKGLMGTANADPDKTAYKSAFFDRFVRKGDETGMKDLATKAMSIGTPADGGYAVPEEIDREIEKLERDMSPVRSIARVIRVGTSDYKKLVNINGIASGWVGETAARPATNTSQLAEIVPPMGELYANPQVTQQALDDMFYDVEADVTGQLLEEFAVAEGAAFVTGNGTNKPKGFLAYTTAATADSARAFGTLEHIATGVSADFAASNKADIFYSTIGALKQAYRTGSVWVMNKSLMFEAMRFKDTTGQYLWQPSLQESMPIKLLGFGVVEAEDMPVKAANSLSIAFGNFKRGYYIVDRVGMRMLRDPYTNKPYVGFYTTKRVGGAVVNSEAIKLIKFI